MLAVLLLGLLCSTASDSITYRATFDISDITITSIDGYDFFTLGESSYLTEPGYPSLPRKSLVFVIPSDRQISGVEAVRVADTVLTGTYNVYPTQREYSISYTDSITFTEPDSVIYSLNTFWPQRLATGSYLGRIDGTALARVDLLPMVWNPVTGKVTFHSEFEVRILLEAGTQPLPSPVLMSEHNWRIRLEQLSAVVENSDSIAAFSVQPNLVDENTMGTDNFPIALEYVILTPAAWSSAWQPLLEWNIKRGLLTEVVALEEVASLSGTFWEVGRDWPETIRNCIRWYHENRGAQYFLLATDSSPYSGCSYNLDEVPMRYCKLYSDMMYIWNYTDWYYACLDPVFNWQTNSNPPWGEYWPPDHPTQTNDLMDLMPDVSVGRIPVHSSAEARDAALALVSYQKHDYSSVSPSSDLLIVSAAAPMSDYPETWEHLQEIVSVVPGYIGVRWLAEYSCTIPQAVYVTPGLVEDHLEGTASNSGYYRVNFGGHGGPTWIGANPEGLPGDQWKVYSHDLNSLDDTQGMYCTGYAFNCLTGRFVTEGTSQSIVETWLGSDEQLIHAPLGRAYTGNSNAGKNSSIVGGSTSHNLNKWFLDALYNQVPSQGTWGIGDVLNSASVVFAGEYYDGYPYVIPPPLQPGDMAFEPMSDIKSLNLGGDPAMPVWLRSPMVLTVDHPAVLNCPSTLYITAESSGGVTIPGVRVCILMRAQNGFEIYCRGYTDSAGTFSQYIAPAFTGTLSVTLTKQGYLPYEGEVRLIAQ